MANKLEELKSAIGAGARANKYRINFSVPTDVPTVSNIADADVLCKSASFPSVEIGQIEAWNQGRKLLIPGDTSYANTWELTFYTTEDHGLRRDMIAWMRYTDHFQNNQHTGVPGALMGELSVEQLDSAGVGTAKYTFHNVWVSSVGELSLGDDTSDTIHEFAVTFSFTDWVVGDANLNLPAKAGAPTNNVVAG